MEGSERAVCVCVCVEARGSEGGLRRRERDESPLREMPQMCVGPHSTAAGLLPEEPPLLSHSPAD